MDCSTWKPDPYVVSETQAALSAYEGREGVPGTEGLTAGVITLCLGRGTRLVECIGGRVGGAFLAAS